MDAAIWIRADAPGIWLVELLPAFSDDDDVASPIVFSAGKSMRYEVSLIAGNGDSMRRAIKSNPELARWIADGKIMHGDEKAAALVELAEKHAAAPGQASRA